MNFLVLILLVCQKTTFSCAKFQNIFTPKILKSTSADSVKSFLARFLSEINTPQEAMASCASVRPPQLPTPWHSPRLKKKLSVSSSHLRTRKTSVKSTTTFMSRICPLPGLNKTLKPLSVNLVWSPLFMAAEVNMDLITSFATAQLTLITVNLALHLLNRP